MCEILIFGGTTEGRLLAEFCAENKISVYISVATDYGENLLENSKYVQVLKGRMTAVEMTDFIENNGVKTVVDATHPYAVEVTKNICTACENSGARYIRIKRNPGKLFENAKYFGNINSLVKYLNTTKGKVFITTGSKELKNFCEIENFSERCVARVLPSENIVEECVKLGFSEHQIIAEKGPFSEEQNMVQLQKFNALYLVTKESGSVGGFESKVNAALKCGAEVLIVERPQDSGVTLEDAEKILLNSADKKITVVGIGTDGIQTMTKEALNAVENADVLIGAKRMLKPFEELKKPCFESYISSEIAKFIFDSEHKNIAVLMSGDCGFYSGTQKLLPLLDGLETEIICGISSPVYFCSKLKIPWSNLRFVSLHGKHENIIRNVCISEKTFFLLGGDVSPKDICRKLCEFNLSGVKVYIGENLSLESERILCGIAKDFTDIETDNLCVMIVENQDFEKCVKSCISDDEFIRGKVPMTKAEVRSICVSKLEIGSSDICWDIGSGTGSVSAEMAIRCFDGIVYAVEKNPEAAELTDKNRHKFGCDNIQIICDYAENAVRNLPAPDCVFVGGSSGKLEKIIDTAFEKNPKVKIIVTAVSLETLNESIKIFDKIGINTDITQISVTRAHKIGSHTMLKAENPIFIINANTKTKNSIISTDTKTFD